MTERLFEDADHAKTYAAGRPGYPIELVNFVIENVKRSTGCCDLAVDVGCGSGQNTSLYVDHFKKIIATDISASQVKEANATSKHENVEYICTTAESIPTPDNSVDLITCAAAFHWFNQEAFFKEAERVLKPGGCLAIYVYVPHHSFASKELNEMFEEVYWNKVRPYQHSRITEIIEHGLSNVKVPFPFRLERNDYSMTFHQPLEVTLAFYDSLSFHRIYSKAHPDDNLIDTLRQRCKEFAEKQSGPFNDHFDHRLQYHFLLTRKPGGCIQDTS